MAVFESKFKEGQDNSATCDCGVTQSQTMSVRILPDIEPFEVLHPLLCYLYTDRVCFTTVSIEGAKSFHQTPLCDPEKAYCVEDMFGFSQLKEKALNFLVATSDDTHIFSRTCGEMQ